MQKCQTSYANPDPTKIVFLQQNDFNSSKDFLCYHIERIKTLEWFSRIENQPAKTPHDEYWHVHIDKETYPSFHYTSLLYLTDFGEDFSGGEFVFVDVSDKLNRTIEPRLARLSFFTSGIENKHHVKPVISGVRYALTLGFTCDVSKAIQQRRQAPAPVDFSDSI